MQKSGDPQSFSDEANSQAEGAQSVSHHEQPPADAAPAASSSNATQTAHPSAELRIAELEEQLRQKEDLYLRAMADGENIRRRAQDEVVKAGRFAIDNFAQSLVPVKDSLEAALATPDQSVEALIAGVQMTLKQLSSAFERHHLTEVAPEAGTVFDPNRHQAISSIASEHPANTVVQTLQKGYLLAERVLRPALVVVSAAK